MIKIKNAINIYSDLNDWIDFVILVDDEQLIRASGLIKLYYDAWFDGDSDETIANYISNGLSKYKIEHEIYFRG